MAASAVAPAASLNWREIDLVLQELDLPGLLIRDISQPDAKSLHLDLAGRGRSLRLLVRLAPPLVRLHATARRAGTGARPDEEGPGARTAAGPPRFAAFLRAHVRGGRLVEASQIGQERVVRLAVHRSDAETILWIRLWSNAGNAILCTPEGRILDAFYRRPSRGELTGGTFTPPSQRAPARSWSIRELPGDGTFNERLDRAAREAQESGAAAEALQSAVRALEGHEGRIVARMQAIDRQLEENAGYDMLRVYGDLIIANMARAAKGSRWLELEDARIELDPALSPSENAQAYFARYKRSRKAASRLQAERSEQESALARLRSALAALSSDAGAPEVALARQALRDLGIGGRPLRAEQSDRGAQKEQPPGLRLRSGPFTILVGRSAAENDELLRRWVRGNDAWFHCRDFPGGYVFVRSLPGKSIPLEVMLDAANLAVHYSRAKASGAADVYYTAVKHLRRPRKGKLGLVLPTQEKNLRVRYEPERIRRLKAQE